LPLLLFLSFVCLFVHENDYENKPP
jgi:hypothetical protein